MDVLLLAAGIGIALVGLGAIALTRRRREVAAPPPPPAPRPPPEPPRRAGPDDAEQRELALKTWLDEAANAWLDSLRRCPRCGGGRLSRTTANYQSHSTRTGGFATHDVHQRCGACGWRRDRIGALDHAHPAPTRWRPLTGRPGPRRIWVIGAPASDPAPPGDGPAPPAPPGGPAHPYRPERARIAAGGGQGIAVSLADDDDDAARSAAALAERLIGVALRVELDDLSDDAQLTLREAAVKRAMVFGALERVGSDQKN